MKEKIFNVSFKQFLRTPFSVILIVVILGFVWLGKYLLTSVLRGGTILSIRISSHKPLDVDRFILLRSFMTAS